MRTLIIGDIHGNIKALKEVLKKASFNIEEDRLICLGDYVDGWNYSFEVVRKLLEIKKNATYEPIFIQGNHDYWLQEALKEQEYNFYDVNYMESMHPDWYMFGGAATHASYCEYDYQFIKIHKKEFFDQLKKYHIEDNKLFVHAGFDPKIGFDFTLKFREDQLLWGRSLFRASLEKYEKFKRKGILENDYKFDLFDKIYIGHTPTVKVGYDTPVKMCNVINLDQGCKINGTLTAWVDETDEYFQSEVTE